MRSPTFHFNRLAHNLNLDDLEQAEQRELVLLAPGTGNLTIFQAKHAKD